MIDLIDLYLNTFFDLCLLFHDSSIEIEEISF